MNCAAKGYGMIDGKVADPEDPFHSFMLNGYGYLGIARMAEMLEKIDPAESAETCRKEADAWREDIRASYFASEMKSPLMPLADGTWCSDRTSLAGSCRTASALYKSRETIHAWQLYGQGRSARTALSGVPGGYRSR